MPGSLRHPWQQSQVVKERGLSAEMARALRGSGMRLQHVAFALLALLSAGGAIPARASTFTEEKVVCPVGGEKFTHMALMSISTWGALPDGMPLGSGRFPVELPQCPTNGLVMYRDFTPQEVERLAPFIASEEYRALRSAGETPRYLAYRTAQFLGDKDLHWWLLEASWEAKNDDPDGERARRYNAEFVEAAKLVQPDARNMEAIAARFRLANGLREMGRFDEAEAVRASIVISPKAGGSDADARENRKGWSGMIANLAGPIARRETGRTPIDMLGERVASGFCLRAEVAAKFKEPPPPPLSAFEQEYCAGPKLAEALKEQRKWLREDD